MMVAQFDNNGLMNMNNSVSQHAFSAKQVLENEMQVAKHQGIDMYDLMARAGLAIFQCVHELSLTNKSMLVVCGKGNNGGDGFVVARLALMAGFKVTTVFLSIEKVPLLLKAKPLGVNELGNRLSGDAKTAYQHLIALDHHVDIVEHNEQLIQLIENKEFSVVVDAIFGIGFRGILPDFLQQIIKTLNQCTGKKVAVDLPSGINATTGAVNSLAFHADVTVSFIVQKQGLYTGSAVNYTGTIKLADLNVGQTFIEQISTTVFVQQIDNLPKLPIRKQSTHKGDVGLLLAIGGNEGMPGAIRLASEAALRSGAALVSVCSHETNHILIHSSQPELMIAGANVKQLFNNNSLSKVKLVLIGPGLGTNQWATDLFTYVLTLNKPMVVDADALNILSKRSQYCDNWVLTPHPGEAARLLACSLTDVENDRFESARKIAQKYGGICVLKGAGTIVSDGSVCWLNTTGNPSMASGGMGDVLAGIIAALFMQMGDKLAAVRLAVFLHGLIADQIVAQQGSIGLLASDIIAQIPTAINQINSI
jgi:NAD(P)H-hydrate epimerase